MATNIRANPLFSTLAIDNCKCQDAAGQYNDLTKLCCINQTDRSYATYPGPNHQVRPSSSCLKIMINQKLLSARIIRFTNRLMGHYLTRAARTMVLVGRFVGTKKTGVRFWWVVLTFDNVVFNLSLTSARSIFVYAKAAGAAVA